MLREYPGRIQVSLAGRARIWPQLATVDTQQTIRAKLNKWIVAAL